MSRIGNRILQIPEGVTVEEKDGNITVTGPKGTLTMPSSDKVKLSVESLDKFPVIVDIEFVAVSPETEIYRFFSVI